MSLSARTALGWDLAYRNAWKVGLVFPVVSLVQLGFGLLLEDALAGRAIGWADVGSGMLFQFGFGFVLGFLGLFVAGAAGVPIPKRFTWMHAQTTLGILAIPFVIWMAWFLFVVL